MARETSAKGRPSRYLLRKRSSRESVVAAPRRATRTSNLKPLIRRTRRKRSSQDVGEEGKREAIEDENDFPTFDGFRQFALGFLERFSESQGDAEDIALVLEVLNKYQMVFEKRYFAADEGAGLDGAETDMDLLECLERTSNFVTRLRYRDKLSKEGEHALEAVSGVLHTPLRDRVEDQTPYNYLPLHFNPQTRVADIRVLHLLSRPGETLQGRIEHLNVDSIPFIALSYEWGDADRLFSIEIVDVDSKSLGNISLTASLYNALCNLRDSLDATMQSFWIDQISINQEDEKERGHQVDMMGKIYTAAKHVVSYLGPGESSDEEGFRLMDRIEGQFGHLYDSPMLHDDRSSTYDLYNRQKQIPEVLIFVDEEPDSAWRSLSRLVYGPWTRRLWMVQETCLNPAEDDVVLMRGKKTLPFTRAAAVQVLQHVGLIPTERLSTTGNQGTVASLCWNLRGGKTGRGTKPLTSLASLLTMLANAADCSDPRDRVFALLGLAKDAQDLGIVADYKKTYAEVLHDVSVRIMSRQQHKKFLQPLEYWQIDNIENALGLPSWVSRWPVGSKLPSPFPVLNAATRWSGPVRFSADNLRLEVRGLRVGRVQQKLSTSGKHLIGQLTSSDLDRFTSMLVTARAHLDRHHPHPGATLINTILAPDEDEALSEDDVDEVFELLLRLIALARDDLHEDREKQKVRLLPSTSTFAQAEQQLLRNIIMKSRLDQRSICLTDRHRICLVPQHAQAGDLVVAFRGGQTLYVIRPHGKHYYYVGDVYMYGLMNGELMEKEGWKKLTEKFTLI